jgi:hypothetical protein
MTAHQSGGLGNIQGDSIRNITAIFPADDSQVGSLGTQYATLAGRTTKGAIRGTSMGGIPSVDLGSEYNLSSNAFVFDASLMVPTSNENIPVNTAVKYLIKAAN